MTFDSTLHQLPSLGGDAQANGINDSGVVVGWSQDNSSPKKTLAAMWLADTSAHSLGTLGGVTSQAFAVNTAGNVVG